MRTRSKRNLPALDALVGEMYANLAAGASLVDAVATIGTALGTHITALHREAPGEPGSMELSGALALDEMIALHADYERRFQGQNLWVVRSLDTLPRQGVQA